MKCLVTKLGMSIDNDNLDYLDAIAFDCVAVSAGTTIFSIAVAEGCEAECISEGMSFSDGQRKKSITPNTPTSIKTNGVAGRILIHCKYLTITRLVCTTSFNISFKLDALRFQQACITDWNISSPSSTSNVRGDVKSAVDAISNSLLAETGFNKVNFNNFPNVIGSLEDTLVSILNRGISNTDLQIRTVGSGITLNDINPGTCYCVIDASAGTIGVYSNSAHSVVKASYSDGKWSY